jgi:hypothetical protein
MVVYHGSENTIKQPVYGKGVQYNDYGRGFYMTKDKGLAGEWAVLTTAKAGYINEYRFDANSLMVLNLDRLPIKYWVAILMDNRKGQYTDIVLQDIKSYKQKYLIDISGFDAIIGWRADDSYFQFVEDFVSRNLSIENLQKSMHLGNLGQQVCIKSERAFAKLEFIRSHQAELQRYYQNAVDRDNEARMAYRKLVSSGKAREGTLISDLMQEAQDAGI